MAVEPPSDGDLLDAMASLLSRFSDADKGHDIAPEEMKVRKDGILIARSRSDPCMVMFHFVTPDDYEVRIEFDTEAARGEGRPYIDRVMSSLLDRLEKNRSRRSPLILPSRSPMSVKTTLTKADRKLLH